MILGHSFADAHGNILAMDATVADVLWRSPKSIVGVSYLDLTYEDDRDWNRTQVGGLEAGGGPVSIRKRYIRADGSLLPIDLEVSLLQTGSDAGRLVAGFRLAPVAIKGNDPRQLWETARYLAFFDRLRHEGLGDEMTGDPLWSVLLHTYLAEAEGRVADEQRLTEATGLSLPLLRRWLLVLERRGLVEPPMAPYGSRQLTSLGVRTLEPMFSRLRAAGPS